MKEQKNKKNKIIKGIALLGLFLLVFGVSYALFSVVLNGTKRNKITTANLELRLTDTNGFEEEEGYGINLENALPISDEEGLKTEPYQFVVTNTGSIPASYTLRLNDVEDVTNTLEDQYIKYNLVKKDYLKSYQKNSLPQGISTTYYKRTLNCPESGQCEFDFKPSTLENRVLDETTILPGESIEYTLNLWLDYEATVEQAANKVFETKIQLNGIQATSFAKGKVGENIDYTLYNDGTLILTGEGPINGLEFDEEFNLSAINNNGGPIYDLIYNYLTKNGVTLPEMKGENELLPIIDMVPFLTDEYNGFMLTARENEYSDENIDYCYNYNGGSRCDNINPKKSLFDSADKLKQSVKLVKEIPFITRIIVNEGITTIPSMAFNTPETMITLPTTLEKIDIYSLFSNYTLNIPNNVSQVKSNAIGCYSYSEQKEFIINIDNTEEYVKNNWNETWVDPDCNPKINYLR